MKISSKTPASRLARPHGKRPMRRVILMLRWIDYEIIRGIVAFAREAPWIINDWGSHGMTVDFARRMKCDGTIMIPRDDLTEPVVKNILAAGIHVVCLNNELRGIDIPRVLPDNAMIGGMAARHLLERGFRRLAFYQSDASSVETDRMEAFRKVASAEGAEFFHLDFSRDTKSLAGDDRIQQLAKALRKLPRPVGVMGQCDRTANHLVLACEQAGLNVPDDIAVVGVDNDPVSSELGIVPLTSVDSDRFGFGYEAARLLDGLMTGATPPREPLLIRPKGIVVRKSTDAIAVEDPSLAKALRFIWERFAEPIGVDDVAVAATVSRRKLYTLFQNNLHRTVKEEIDRARVRHASLLLRDTDEKLFAVASASGFPSAFQLARAFQRLERCSPAEYRNTHRNPSQTR